MKNRPKKAGEVVESVLRHMMKNSGMPSNEIEATIKGFRSKFPDIQNNPAAPQLHAMADQLKKESDEELMLMEIYAAGRD